jgi:hypothetical protein
LWPRFLCFLVYFAKRISYAHPWESTWDGDNPPYRIIPTPSNAGRTAGAVNDPQRHELDPSTENEMLVDVAPQVTNQDAMEIDSQESARLQDPVSISEMDTGEPNDLVNVPSEGVDPVEADALATFIEYVSSDHI